MSFFMPVSAILFATDMILGALLVPWYYLHGLTVVRVRRSVRNGLAPVPGPDTLETTPRSFVLGGPVFRDLGGLTYAFRRSFFHGSGILQCVLVFDPRAAVLEVRARIGWFFLVCVVILMAWLLGSGAPDSGLFLLVLGALISVDVLQCFKTATNAQRLWERSEENPAA